ncbi:C40 family peptidase [Reinekea marina]|uniref:C40 family peptidase n=1 Tax=Reinekea marina TaxID=1310421 RepID=A0ABV7WWH2_9GAMM|nr:C40 family peptidase [Reinekea marina]MBU2865336.1 C40 family peptidase [Reinekea forsetii]MDN3647940.1 C40 family peptidase [Reinekea marina]
MRNFFLLLSIAVSLTACANFQALENSPKASQPVMAQGTFDSVYEKYQGTPYRYGGTGKGGFDCSGFINVAFLEARNQSLPRTTEQLIKSGQVVRRDQLREGDLVFFKTGAKQLHAGIYVGQNAFIHASTSKGVIESSLANDYWANRYIQARRIN